MAAALVVAAGAVDVMKRIEYLVARLHGHVAADATTTIAQSTAALTSLTPAAVVAVGATAGNRDGSCCCYCSQVALECQ